MERLADAVVINVDADAGHGHYFRHQPIHQHQPHHQQQGSHHQQHQQLRQEQQRHLDQQQHRYQQQASYEQQQQQHQHHQQHKHQFQQQQHQQQQYHAQPAHHAQQQQEEFQPNQQQHGQHILSRSWSRSTSSNVLPTTSFDEDDNDDIKESDCNAKSGDNAPDSGHLRRFGRFLTARLKASTPYVVLCLYSIAGAYVFIALEKHYDIEERREHRMNVAVARHNLIGNITVATAHSTNENLTARLLACIHHFEKSINFKLDDRETVWDFYSSVLYAGTIYTTIGYGHIACKTTPGRLMTILYAVVGIPLTLTVLNQLGTLLLNTMVNITGFMHNMQARMKEFRQKRRDNAALALLKNSGVAPKASLEEFQNLTLTPENSIGRAVDDLNVEDENIPPIWVALTSTIGWLFVCAGIFKIWEPWDYFTSFYFFFISLSTVGLGDVVPHYPEYMLMSVVLVFFGLALVSVCINVVQQTIENIYMRLLKRLLFEYINRLADGEGEFGASVGMMQSWANNKKAKFLVPLLGKTKLQMAMQRFQEEAKAQGVELPSTLTHLDPVSALPNILTVDKQEDVQKVLDEMEQHSTLRASQTSIAQLHVNLADVARQQQQTRQATTTTTTGRDAAVQTTGTDAAVKAVQVSLTTPPEWRDDIVQTDWCEYSLREAASQTSTSTRRSAASQTPTLRWHSVQSQTDLPTAGRPTLRCSASQTDQWSDVGRRVDYLSQARRRSTGFRSLSGSRRSLVAGEQTLSKSLSHSVIVDQWSAQPDDAERPVDITLPDVRPEITVTETPVQTAQCWFDLRESICQTDSSSIGADMASQTTSSWFARRSDASQTPSVRSIDQSLQTLTETDDAESQTVRFATAERQAQIGLPYSQMRCAGSQTIAATPIRHREMQTMSSSMLLRDHDTQTLFATDQKASQTTRHLCKAHHVETQTGYARCIDRGVQTQSARARKVTNVAVQTGILSRVAHLVSKNDDDQQLASHGPSTSANAPLFRQMSLQKIPPPVKRRMTSASLLTTTLTPPEPVSPLQIGRRSLRRIGQLPEVRTPSPTPPPDATRLTVPRAMMKMPSVKALTSQFERRLSTPQVEQIPEVTRRRSADTDDRRGAGAPSDEVNKVAGVTGETEQAGDGDGDDDEGTSEMSTKDDDRSGPI